MGGQWLARLNAAIRRLEHLFFRLELLEKQIREVDRATRSTGGGL